MPLIQEVAQRGSTVLMKLVGFVFVSLDFVWEVVLFYATLNYLVM